MTGAWLERLAWPEAERALTRDAIVLLPLGAAAKEHGPHLRLDNDAVLAARLAELVAARFDGPLVVAPLLSSAYYPAFRAYPGSITLRLETARDVVVDVAQSLAAHGPRRFYVLNTGVSTVEALRPAAAQLAKDGIALRFTDWPAALRPAERLVQQERGTHADEVETSLMLFLAPDHVRMERAVKEVNPQGKGGLTRDPEGPGTFSASGVWGDPTLATRAKGEAFAGAVVEHVVRDLHALRAHNV
ncbi:MAG: creatininase family protein [Halobacteriales archaeon]|nr:creatininase family protein [Halobacteriales archaeon]